MSGALACSTWNLASVSRTLSVVSLLREGAKQAKEARTDDKGNFIAKVLPGKYGIRAVATGFSAVIFSSVEVKASQELVYKFNLEPIRVPQKYQNKTYWKGEKHGQLSCDPVGKNPGDVWAFRNVKHNHEEQTVHPCQFPEDMIERIVLATTDVGDVVLDPYVGSGTTAVVAKRLGRRYIGFDTNREYVEVAVARLSGEPDPKGNFPNLRSLREYAEKKGLSDVSGFRFTRQVGKVATTRDKAKIFPEQMHLTEILDELESQASESAYRRAARLETAKT